jgi:ubiquinone biosynthesis protein
VKLADLNRLRQITTTAARYGFQDLLERAGLFRRFGKPQAVTEPLADTQRESTARRFRRLLDELGPTFVKLGQILSTRADLLPAEFIAELRLLQDAAAPIPLEQVRAQLEAAFGQPVDELFASIEPAPLAAASIAQVHRARTRGGDEVVVKVQRPDITAHVNADLAVLHALARLLEATVEEMGIYSPVGIVEEFDRAIHEELDFVHEAANVHAFAATHAERPALRIPKVFDELTTSTVLTLEFLEGTRLVQADLSAERRQALAKVVVDASFQQLFVDGLFHGDPHPGNFLLLEGDVVGLLDFGLVGRLTRAMQETLVLLSVAVALKDADSVARLLYRMGAPDSRANLAGFRADVETLLQTHLPEARTLAEVNARHLLTDLLDLAVRYRIRIPREYALLSRAAVAVEGLLRELAPDLDILAVSMPYAKQLLAGRYDPAQLRGGLMRTLLRFQGLASDLPTQLSQILMDLETGRFGVTVKSPELEKINQSLRSVAVIGFLGLAACGFIVGAFLSFAQMQWTVHGLPFLGVFGLVAAAGLFGAAFTWYLFGHRVGKISLRRFLPKR